MLLPLHYHGLHNTTTVDGALRAKCQLPLQTSLPWLHLVSCLRALIATSSSWANRLSRPKVIGDPPNRPSRVTNASDWRPITYLRIRLCHRLALGVRTPQILHLKVRNLLPFGLLRELAYMYSIDYRSLPQHQIRENAFSSNAPSASRFTGEGSQTPTARHLRASSDQSESSGQVKATCRTCENLHGLVNSIVTELHQLQTEISGVIWKQVKPEHGIYMVGLERSKA